MTTLQLVLVIAYGGILIYLAIKGAVHSYLDIKNYRNGFKEGYAQGLEQGGVAFNILMEHEDKVRANLFVPAEASFRK